MEILKRVLFILILVIIYVYVCNISMLPNDIILMQGETLRLKTIFGLNVQNEEKMQA